MDLNSGSIDYVKQKKTPQFWADVIHDLSSYSVGRVVENGAKINGVALTVAAELLPAWMRDTPFDQGMRLWASSWKKTGHSLEHANDQVEEAAKSGFKQASFHSDEWGDWMIQRGMDRGGDTHVNRELNFGFFTHNRSDDEQQNGSLNEINIDAVVEAFSQDIESKNWPNLLLNCNHALIRDHYDISGIMKGFHALASYSFADKKTGRSRDLKLTMRHDDRENGHSSEENSKNTIMLAAVFNDYNAWVNGGKLIKRINHLDRLHEREAETPLSREEREREYIGVGDAAMSPASVMLAKLILKLIVEDPSKIHIPTRENFESYGPYIDDKTYDGDLMLALLNTDEPIKLRDDAGKILQHILPEGYSKGGNIVSDAIRFLLLDLQRPLNKSLDEQRIFYFGDNPKQTITDKQIHDLVFNMGILNVNPGATPLNKYEKAMGMRRMSVGSGGDLIIGHLLERPLMQKRLSQEKDGRDDFYVVMPEEAHKELGHGFLDALGSRDFGDYKKGSGYVIDPQKQKIHDESDYRNAHEVRSRMRVIHAACYDAAGVSNVTHQQIGDDQHHYKLEFSRGASEEAIRQIEQSVATELMKKQVGTIQCDINDGPDRLNGPGACYIAINNTAQENAHEHMSDALKTLASPTRKQPGETELFVGDHVYHRLNQKAPFEEKARSAA